MPATPDALRLLRLSPDILVAGAKASGAGGVAVSALEMVQNSLRYSWPRKQVEERLRQIMADIHDVSAAAAEAYGLGYDLIAGNDIANGCASSLTDRLSCSPSRASSTRRVGSESAAKVRSSVSS